MIESNGGHVHAIIHFTEIDKEICDVECPASLLHPFLPIFLSFFLMLNCLFTIEMWWNIAHKLCIANYNIQPIMRNILLQWPWKLPLLTHLLCQCDCLKISIEHSSNASEGFSVSCLKFKSCQAWSRCGRFKAKK